MDRKTLLYQLLFCQTNVLYAQIDEIQRRMRYREIMSTDCVELLIAMEKLDTLKDLTKSIFAIMRIDSLEYDKQTAEFEERIKRQILK